jgi:hypothetical protein
MRTITKTKTTEATRADNADHADKLFKAGQRIAKGESPTLKESLRVQPAAEPKPFLPKTVERIAAAVADLLTYGGTPEDEERIILAAVSQEYRGKSFRRAFKDVEETVRDGQKYNLPILLKGLADFRIDRPSVHDDQPEATAVAERIRQNNRKQCAREFDGFLRDADPEEVTFLNAVLNFGNQNGKREHELRIATAFLDEIDYGSAEVFRVPFQHAEAVDAYISALMKQSAEEEAN